MNTQSEAILRYVCSKWKVLCIIGICAVLGAMLGMSQITPLYKATAIVTPATNVVAPSKSCDSIFRFDELTQLMLEYLHSNDFKTSIIKAFPETAKKYNRRFSFQRTSYYHTEISVLDENPEKAEMLVNACIQTYDHLRNEELKTYGQTSELQAQTIIIQHAAASVQPVYPEKTKIVFLSVFFSICCAIGILLIIRKPENHA